MLCKCVCIHTHVHTYIYLSIYIYMCTHVSIFVLSSCVCPLVHLFGNFCLFFYLCLLSFLIYTHAVSPALSLSLSLSLCLSGTRSICVEFLYTQRVMYVCMYVRIYVCMYACMHVCIDACMCACMCVCAFIF